MSLSCAIPMVPRSRVHGAHAREQKVVLGKPREGTSNAAGFRETPATASPPPKGGNRAPVRSGGRTGHSKPPASGDLKRGVKPELTLRENVTGCVEAVFTLLQVYGCRRRAIDVNVQHSFDRAVQHWERGSKLCDPVKGTVQFAKYKFAAFVYSHYPQGAPAPIPPWLATPELSAAAAVDGFKDNPARLVGSAVGEWINTVLRSSHREGFLSSVSHIKGACPRPGKAFLDASLLGTVKALTTVHPDRPDEFLAPATVADDHRDINFFLCRQGMEEELRRTVDEVFADPQSRAQREQRVPPTYRQFTDELRHRPIFPSTKSTFECGRHLGGNVAVVMSEIVDAGLQASTGLERTDDIIRDDMLPGRSARIKYAATTVEVARDEDEIGWGHLGPARDERDEEIAQDFDIRSLQLQSKLLYETLLARAVRNANSPVTPVVLAEALKARIITKGPGLNTKVLHPLQKFMHGVLKNQATFQLVGNKPVDEWIIQERLGAHLPEDEFYLSGDYSAATDNLAPWVSECIARQIAFRCGLTAEETHLFVLSLTGNSIELPADPKGGKKKVKTFLRQQWGQLMGSIVSFPVLCIANAAMCRWAKEVGEERKMSLHQTGMLINGDDVVFRATLRTYHVWEKVTAFGGLTSSLGKTYLTRSFAQINSVNFLRRQNNDGVDEPIEVLVGEPPLMTRKLMHFINPGFVNLGLMFGLKRSVEIGGDTAIGKEAIADCTEFNSLGARCRDLINRSPSHCRDEVMLEFIYRHKQTALKDLIVPWYVPERLGGVGLPSFLSARELAAGHTRLPDKPDFGPTRLDRQIFARIREGGEVKYPLVRLPRDVAWKTHVAVLESLPEGLLQKGQPSPEEEAVWARLYSSLVCARIYTPVGESKQPDTDRKTSIGDLFDFDENGPVGTRARLCGKRQLATLDRNSKTWARARKSGNLPGPISVDKLLSFTPDRPFVRGRILDLRTLPLPAAPLPEAEVVHDHPHHAVVVPLVPAEVRYRDRDDVKRA